MHNFKFLMALFVAVLFLSEFISTEHTSLQADLLPESVEECLKTENSCSVEVLQSFLCEAWPDLCEGLSWPMRFSIAKLIGLYGEVIADFRLPSPDEVDEYADTPEERVEFIDHEFYEFTICELEVYKGMPSDMRICVDESIYDQKGSHCKLYPKTCAGGSKN